MAEGCKPNRAFHSCGLDPAEPAYQRAVTSERGPTTGTVCPAGGGFRDLCCRFNLDKRRTKERAKVSDGLVVSASTGSSRTDQTRPNKAGGK